MKTTIFWNFWFTLLFIFSISSCKKEIEDAQPTSNPVSTIEVGILNDPKYGDVYQLNPNRVRLGEASNTTQNSISSQARAAGQSLGSQFDGSGQIEVAIWVSRSSFGAHNRVACTVDPGFVCIGGGAYADYGNGGGALLTESRPFDGNFNSWVASSKDHEVSNPHTLSVYAIGIKLRNISATTLKSYMSFSSNISSVANHPNTSVTVPAGRLLAGGGARINYSGPGNLLVNSFPTNSITWQVSGKDHNFLSPASIEAFAIGIPNYIPGFGNLEVSIQSATASVPAYRANIGFTIESGWVLSCLGAASSYSGAGRMLVGMYPLENNSRTVYASSKDHVTATSGSITLRVLRIRKI